MASDLKNIVILGGSYAGISIAHNLLKYAIPQLLHPETYQVVLISTSSQALCRPACPRALISDDLLSQDKLFVSISEAFKQYAHLSFRFEKGTATRVDHEARTVAFRDFIASTEQCIPFHALVIATGCSTASPLLCLSHDETFLKDQWKVFREGLKTASSIVISGGGPTGIEVAGELGEYLNGRPGWFSHKLENPKVQITVVTSGAQILPLLRRHIAEKAEVYLARVGVKVIKNTRVEGTTPTESGRESALAAKTSVALSDGRVLEADLFIPATGMVANTGFLDQGLLASDGRVQTNASTLRVDKAGPRVYAVGDVGNYSRPAVHLTLEAVPVLAANIKRDLLLVSGKGEASVQPDREFKEDKREAQLVPIGTSKGVGSVMGWRLPSFLVWLIKGRDYWLWTTGDLWSGKQWAKEA